MVRERQRLWRRMREGWLVGIAVLFVLAWWLYRKHLVRRLQDKARTAAVLQQLGATYDKVERAEVERSRLMAEARSAAKKVNELHKATEQTAERLAKGGHPEVAKLVRQWNRE